LSGKRSRYRLWSKSAHDGDRGGFLPVDSTRSLLARGEASLGCWCRRGCWCRVPWSPGWSLTRQPRRLGTGRLARERERARSTGNGLTYLARDTGAIRFCRIEGVADTHVCALFVALTGLRAARSCSLASKILEAFAAPGYLPDQLSVVGPSAVKATPALQLGASSSVVHPGPSLAIVRKCLI
jgi:hypothetical protein